MLLATITSLSIAACKKPARAAPPPASVDTAPSGLACTEDASFPRMHAIAEASTAVTVPFAAGASLVVISDSGNHGAALAWPFTDGGPPRALSLPLDAAVSDDVEGAAWHGGTLYTLTSSGAVERFAPRADGSFERVGPATRLGAAPGSCAKLADVNCGRNYEALCLRAERVAGSPLGYAGAKEDGRLYPVAVRPDGSLALDDAHAPLAPATSRRALADCAFAPTGELLVGTNVHDGNRVYVVDEVTAAPRLVVSPPLVNLEAVAVDGRGRLYAFEDNSGAASAGVRYACQGWGERR